MSQDLHRDVKDIKKELKEVHEKLNILIDKISEFEAVLDAADMIEESLEDSRDKEDKDKDIWGSNSWETSLEDDEDDEGGLY
jgi:vacuolar-type H+-ATPase subunit I/STV1